jgi:hypothetical protein
MCRFVACKIVYGKALEAIYGASQKQTFTGKSPTLHRVCNYILTAFMETLTRCLISGSPLTPPFAKCPGQGLPKSPGPYNPPSAELVANSKGCEDRRPPPGVMLSRAAFMVRELGSFGGVTIRGPRDQT